jgi:hypothetical protein
MALYKSNHTVKLYFFYLTKLWLFYEIFRRKSIETLRKSNNYFEHFNG